MDSSLATWHALTALNQVDCYNYTGLTFDMEVEPVAEAAEFVGIVPREIAKVDDFLPRMGC